MVKVETSGAATNATLLVYERRELGRESSFAENCLLVILQHVDFSHMLAVNTMNKFLKMGL